jgi:L-cysteine S-thiosulfotransferase
VTWHWNCAKLLKNCLASLSLYGLGQCCFALTDTPTDPRVSGSTFLSKQLQELQADQGRHPAGLWIERGQQLWQSQCASCHQAITGMKSNVASFPKLNRDKKLVNLEDAIEGHAGIQISSEDVLALSAALHQAAKGEAIRAQPIEPYYSRGQKLWGTRIGRINLACVHCHDAQAGRVGANMRGEVISQAQPTGFPIYRISWQTLGTVERRLRACYSGVQAPIPPAGSPELRDLELFLKVRANGMTMDGPSVRR